MKLFGKKTGASDDSYTVPEAYDESAQQTREWEQDEAEKYASDPSRNPATPCNRRRTIIVWTVVIMAVIMGVAFWLRYMNPYVSDATEQGYVLKIERRGFLFKTWEGELILSRALTDTSHIYQREMSFSVDDEAVARRLQDYQLSGQPVRVSYSRYLGALPWRGSSTFVITSVKPVAQ
ncbi:MAG: hypothetical protein K2M98_01470 [Muribaculum sp.]|nr:hypothetical protein [Muribaculum sp.]